MNSIIEHNMDAVRFPADLGILGGMGPQATHYFTEELLSAIEINHHPQKDQDYPNIFVRYACHIPDRTTMLLNDRKPLIKAIMREAEILVALGCLKIVMPCITAHALLDTELCQFPFIDIPKVVATHILRSFPSANVGILATRGTRLSRVLDKLLPVTHNVMYLKEQEEDELMDFIYKKAKTWDGGKNISTLRDLYNKLRERGCDVVIAGCTEVETCFARYSPKECNLVLPLRTVAQFYATTWTRK